MAAAGELTVRLRRLHASQRRVVAGARRFNVAACGRRWGKTTLGENRLLTVALGDARPTGWFAPTYKQLAEAWRQLRDDLAPVTRHKSETEHRIATVTGGVVECWSLDEPNAARGRAYARVVIDEAAHVAGLEEAWTRVIRPTLTDHRGDAWFLSTPNGLNYFWTLYQRGVDPAIGEWAAWRLPTRANPFIAPEEVEAARGDLPERAFQQEHEAAFLEDAGAVFRRVREAATATPQVAALPGHAYCFGVDWGRHHDFTAIAVLDLTTREVVALDRFAEQEWDVQYARLRALADRFRPALVIAEANAMGSPASAALRTLGLPVWEWTTTNATKAAGVQALALALEQGQCRIPNDPVLVGELLAYRAERLPSGLLRYGAPEGQHDDTVIALVLAWQGAAYPAAGAATAARPYQLGTVEPAVARAEREARDWRGHGGVNPWANDPEAYARWLARTGRTAPAPGPAGGA